MYPARERSTWLALVASAGASFMVGMRAREKSILLRAFSTRGARGRERRSDLGEVRRTALEEGREGLLGLGGREALGEGGGLLLDAGAKGVGVAAQEGPGHPEGARRARGQLLGPSPGEGGKLGGR